VASSEAEVALLSAKVDDYFLLSVSAAARAAKSRAVLGATFCLKNGSLSSCNLALGRQQQLYTLGCHRDKNYVQNHQDASSVLMSHESLNVFFILSL
jgi:hypothetical protein